MYGRLLRRRFSHLREEVLVPQRPFLSRRHTSQRPLVGGPDPGFGVGGDTEGVAVPPGAAGARGVPLPACAPRGGVEAL